MALYGSEKVVLSIGDGGTPTEQFVTVGGLEDIRLRVVNQLINNETIVSSQWRSFADQAGVHSLSVAGQGVFTDSNAEETLRSKVFSSEICNFQLLFGNGDTVTAPFLIRDYERDAQNLEEERFSITLESAGGVVYISV